MIYVVGLALVFLLGLPALVVILLIGPVYLLSFRFPYAALGTAVAIFAGLIVDHLYNFEELTYADISPWGVLGVPQSYLPFSLLVALGGIGVAAKAVLIRI